MILIYVYVLVYMCISLNVFMRIKKNNRIFYYFSNMIIMFMLKVILYEDDFKNKYVIF